MTGGQIVAAIVALAALVVAFGLLATRVGGRGGVRPAIHGTVRPAPSPGTAMPSPDVATGRVPVRANTGGGPGRQEAAGATTGPGSRVCSCGTPVIVACTDVYGRRPVTVDVTPDPAGVYELIEPSRGWPRVMHVDPTVKIRPTYPRHQCT